MEFTQEEDDRVDELLSEITGRITRIDLKIFEDEMPFKKRKKLQMERGILLEIEAKIKEVWDLNFRKESEWTEPSLATGTDFKWEGSRNRRGDVLVKAKMEGSYMVDLDLDAIRGQGIASFRIAPKKKSRGVLGL